MIDPFIRWSDRESNNVKPKQVEHLNNIPDSLVSSHPPTPRKNDTSSARIPANPPFFVRNMAGSEQAKV